MKSPLGAGSPGGSTARFAAVSVFLLATLDAADAAACGSCGAGDGGLTWTGAELPIGLGFRASAELRAGSVRVGAPGAGELRIDEQRLDLGLAYAPRSSVRIAASLPLLHRAWAAGEGTKNSFSLGDAELRADGFISVVLHERLRRALGVFGGLRLPTAPEQRAGGQALPAALQPGAGSVTPFLGATFALAWPDYLATFAAALYLPIAVREGPHASTAFRASGAIQRSLTDEVAARIGFQGKLEASTETNGQDDPNSGGFLGFVSTEVVVAPSRRWLLVGGLYFPAVQALRGAHRQGTIAGGSAAFVF